MSLERDVFVWRQVDLLHYKLDCEGVISGVFPSRHIILLRIVKIYVWA